MKNLIIFTKYNEATRFIPLLLTITKINKEVNCYCYGPLKEENIYSKYYKQLKHDGVQFIENEELYHYTSNDIIMTDALTTYVFPLRKKFGENIPIITYNHSKDVATLHKNSYHLVTDLFEYNFLLSRYNVSPQSNTQTFIPLWNTEIFLSGYYHYFETLPFIKQPKTILRHKLEKKYNFKFNPELPLLSYTTGERMRENKFRNLFSTLSENYNIIIKEIGTSKIYNITGKNLFFCSTLREPMLKFASDINFVPIASGTMLSNFAFGLKTIPVFNYDMGEKFSGANLKFLLKKYYNTTNLYHYSNSFPFMEKYFSLVPPMSSYNISGIKKLIENKTFWNNFERKVNIERKKIFGHVNLEDSITNTAQYILQILSK